MRIFQLNTFCGVKSTGRIASEIAKLVEKDGGICRIGYGVPQITEDSKRFAYQIGSPIGRKLHAVLRKLFDAEGYGSFFATRKLINELKSFKPDLVHFHNLHGCYLHIPTLFRYLAEADIPVVWTLHDCWPFTGHCAYFDYADCQKWRKECHSCPQKHSYPVCIGLEGSRRNHRLKKKWFSKLKKLTFVAPCQWMTGPQSASFMNHYPIRVIPNGVNRNIFHPVANDLRIQYHLEDKKICLAVAAEWDERKGLKYICEAAQILRDNYAFVIIGLSQEQLKSLPANAIGFEHTASTEELAAWYTAADCFVNPTMEDNMPMVNLEALACGTPVAVFRTGGCPEAVDQSCGLVVAQGDVQAFCTAIETLCAQKKSMGESCLKRAEYFDCETSFQAYLSLYKEICS